MKRVVCEVKREEHIPRSNLQVTEKAIWLNLVVWMKKQGLLLMALQLYSMLTWL